MPCCCHFMQVTNTLKITNSFYCLEIDTEIFTDEMSRICLKNTECLKEG